MGKEQWLAGWRRRGRFSRELIDGGTREGGNRSWVLEKVNREQPWKQSRMEELNGRRPHKSLGNKEVAELLASLSVSSRWPFGEMNNMNWGSLKRQARFSNSCYKEKRAYEENWKYAESTEESKMDTRLNRWIIVCQLVSEIDIPNTLKIPYPVEIVE